MEKGYHIRIIGIVGGIVEGQGVLQRPAPLPSSERLLANVLDFGADEGKDAELGAVGWRGGLELLRVSGVGRRDLGFLEVEVDGVELADALGIRFDLGTVLAMQFRDYKSEDLKIKVKKIGP